MRMDELKLNPLETQIFEMLYRAGDKGASREELLEYKVPVPTRKSNVIDVHIKNLRKKLVGTQYEIQTIRGVGYRIYKVKK